jgi:hypothetical protein
LYNYRNKFEFFYLIIISIFELLYI